MAIPRVFHRIWLGTKPLPEEFRQFGLSWEQLHPGWEMKLWTDANMPSLANRALFDKAPSFAAKTDILRYELLLRFGGVYVDTDFECLKSIELLLGGVECFVAQQKDLDADFGKFCYVNNALMGAVPGHPLFRVLVESLPQHMASLPPDAPASYLTGPHFLTTVLQTHPGVKIYPAKFFYPYTAMERWRRHERFPEAYAVHHWTLSDVAVNRTKPRKLGTETVPCLSVCLRPVEHDDGTRLRWVLEGLCLQSVTDFEVLIPHGLSPELNAVFTSFEGRLRLRSLPPSLQPALRAGAMETAVRTAQGVRVLFLDTDCLPDPDVVETHARSGAKAELLFAYRRIYPAEKFFPYRDAVDYTGLVQHCRPERTGLYVVPSADRWKDVEPACFSVPVVLTRHIGGPEAGIHDVRELARILTENNCPSAPCIYGARVTQLGVPNDCVFDANGGVANPALVPFQLNQSVASVRRLSSASGRGMDGRSPYALRQATLNGVQTREISALQFHLLETLQSPKPPEEAIRALTERVAVEIEKRPRVLALCRSYIESFVAEGILVPVRGEAAAGLSHQ